ncbi:MAG: isopentenyl-diphosphate Delta-isomerase [Patescibacteria group bacterium]|nr:isopentenyl-diphosphate Delta-isomerase [Patescibacteria group bacterium]
MEKLILVDKNDKILGFEEKVKCHLNEGLLHRAFTILLFDDNDNILLQKRAKSKMLWPLYWEATCSSHPRENETYEQSGKRRLKEELRVNADLKLIDKFYYQSFYKDIGAEHELCATLVGSYNEREIDFNKDEVTDLKWIEINELKKELNQDPQDYAPWLKIVLDRIEQKYGEDIKSIL